LCKIFITSFISKLSTAYRYLHYYSKRYPGTRLRRNRHRNTGTVHSGLGYSASALIPDKHALEKAASILNEGKKVAILVGAGADFSYAEYAKLIGLDGIRVENPDDIDNALDKAILADKPFVLETVTDPTVPMLPPHITVKQRKEFVTSLLKGDPEAGRIIKQVYSQLTEKYNVE
jgi:hypothetical protein